MGAPGLALSLSLFARPDRPPRAVLSRSATPAPRSADPRIPPRNEPDPPAEVRMGRVASATIGDPGRSQHPALKAFR